jgi:hypothetical protein
MKKKVIYLLTFICCLSLFSSAKQIGIGCIKKCNYEQAMNVKEKPAKAKKVTPASIRPFTFYLFNI